MRWCTLGHHQVTVDACQAEDGSMRATCRTCRANLSRAHPERTAPAALAELQAAPLRNEYEAAAGEDDANGVEAAGVDEFDVAFGDRADLMDVDSHLTVLCQHERPYC
jgi:hypothetical protein